MPILVTCTCGKTLRVADEHAGRRIKCPACNTITTAQKPEAEPIFEVVETAPQPAPAAPRPAVPVARPRVEDEEYDGTVYGMARSNSGISGEEEDDRPRDKPLPDFRLGSGQRGKKRKKK